MKKILITFARSINCPKSTVYNGGCIFHLKINSYCIFRKYFGHD